MTCDTQEACCAAPAKGAHGHHCVALATPAAKVDASWTTNSHAPPLAPKCGTLGPFAGRRAPVRIGRWGTTIRLDGSPSKPDRCRMRRPSISLPTLVRKPQLSRAQLPHAAGAVVLLFAIATAVMSLSSSAHAWFDWVPVSNDQIVIDSALTLLMAIFLLVIAAAVILPLTMAIHTIGHATAGYFFGMRLLAVRVGPVLFTPWTVGNRFELLPISGKADLMTGWCQFDDSPLPTWKRLRGWQVMTVGGSGMNLLVSLVFSIMSIFASGVTYVLFREMVWLNLAACIVNLIPFVLPSLDFESDGKHLLALLLDADDGADALIEKLRDQVVVGPLRPASWPREREAAWEAKLRQTPATAEGR